MHADLLLRSISLIWTDLSPPTPLIQPNQLWLFLIDTRKTVWLFHEFAVVKLRFFFFSSAAQVRRSEGKISNWILIFFFLFALVTNIPFFFRKIQTSSVTWRMRAPEKKPLVNLDKDDRIPQVQRAEKVKQESPIQALSEFDTSEIKRQPDFY